MAREVKTVIVDLYYTTDTDYLKSSIPDEYYGYGRELVHCKDCKKYYPKTEERDSYCPFVGRIGLEPEGYCAWAERKADNG